MANKYENSKDLLRQAQVKAILDYFQVISMYRLARSAKADGKEVFEMLEGKKLLDRVEESFNANIIDPNAKNIELLTQLSNVLSALSTEHVSLSNSVNEEFARVEWLDFAISCINMDATADNTLNHLNKRIDEMYKDRGLRIRFHDDDDKKIKILNKIFESSDKFKKKI